MDTTTATALLGLLNLVNTLIDVSNESILDSNGQVIAGNLQEYKAQISKDLFKQQFEGKSPDEINKEIDRFLKEEK